MKRFKTFHKTLAVILALLIFLSGLSIVSVSAADIFKTYTGRDLIYVDSNGATIDQVPTGADIQCTLKSDSSYGITWTTGKKYISFTNQVTGKDDVFWRNDTMSYDIMVPNNSSEASTQIVFCIQPHTKYLDGYRIIDTSDKKNPANTAYWTLFMNSSHTTLRDSIAQVIAFAKPMIKESDTNKHPYYIAAQLIIWELIAGYRDPSTLNLVKGKKLTNYIDGDNSKVDAVKNAYKKILKTIGELDNLPTGIYHSFSEAKDNKDGLRFVIKPDATSKTKPVTGVKNYEWDSISIVNENGNKPDESYGLSVSQKKGTSDITVKLKKSIAGKKYYIKFVKKLPEFSKSDDNVGYNTASTLEGAKASQNLVSKLKYDKEVVGYLPIVQEVVEDTGSLQIIKTAVDKDGEEYTQKLSGWWFEVINNKTGAAKYYKTDSDGETKVIENIKLKTEFSITELGKKLSAGYNKDNYTDIVQIGDTTYGFPKDWENLTGGTQVVNVTEPDEKKIYEVKWKNKYNQPFKVTITKDADDDESVAGYYFLAYDNYSAYNKQKKLLKVPTVVGPTNADGNVSFNLDNANTLSIQRRLSVLELGKLKKGVSSFPKTISDVENTTELKALRDCFEIPSQYRIEKNSGNAALNGLEDAVGFVMYREDIEDYEKEIVIHNRTFGRLAIRKQDQYGKPVKGAEYSVYYGKSEEMYSEDNDDIVDAHSNFVCKLVTDENGYAITGDSSKDLLPTGDYYLMETKNPEGYELDKKIYDVEVTPGTDTEETAVMVNFVDRISVVKLNKVDENGDGVSDAKMQVFEKPKSGTIDFKTAKPVLEFVTDGKEKVYKGAPFEVGKTYILHEAESPHGFFIADDVEFTVGTDETKAKVTAIDNRTHVKIIKLDDKKNPVKGAKLQIRKKDGDVVLFTGYDGKMVSSVVTTEEPLDIVGVFEEGETYVLEELEAPKGLLLADPVEFTISSEAKGKTISVTMIDDEIHLEISKKSAANSEELEGAHLALYKGTDDKGELLVEWVSEKTPKVFERLVQEGETYTLVETYPANYHMTAQSITFKIVEGQPEQSVTMVDEPTYIVVKKTDKSGERLIGGNTLELSHINPETGEKEVVDTWVTEEGQSYKIVGKLNVGEKYTITELNPAPGYSTADPIDFIVKDNGDTEVVDGKQTVVMKNEKIQVEFAKLDGETLEKVDGATLQVVDKDGNVVKVKDFDGKEVESWVTRADKNLVVEGVFVKGETYTLKELKSPIGYTTAPDVTFTVEDTSKPQVVTMVDYQKPIEFHKKNLAGTDEIEGAHIVLTEKSSGKVIEEWTSTKEAHVIKGKLEVGNTYVITETIAPHGYAKTESVEFTVEDNNAVQTVEMRDGLTEVQFIKIDSSTKKNVAGAVLQILDSNGNVVQVPDKDGNLVNSWTTDGNPFKVEGILDIDTTYVLHEISAPKGYATAPDKSFTVLDTTEMQSVTMEDDTTKVHISKTDITGTKEVVGAKLKLTDDKGNLIDEWTSSKKPHIFEGKLEAGKKYILSETKPADGFATAENIEFTVDNNGKIKNVVMKDDTIKFEFNKVDASNNKALSGAKLQLLDSKGKEVAHWTTNGNPYQIDGKLIAGETYTLRESEAPKNYRKADDITFKVRDTGARQIVTMKDEPVPEMPKTGDNNTPYLMIAFGITLMLAGVFIFSATKKSYNRR